MKTNHTDAQLQAAIDGACLELDATHQYACGSIVLKRNQDWHEETPARLDLIKSALAALPESEQSDRELAEELAQPDPTETPWTEWHGGECPLKDEEVEEWRYKLANGFTTDTPAKPSAYQLAWSQVDGPFDIIAYRVLKWREGFGPVDWKAKFEFWNKRCLRREEELKQQQTRAEKVEAELARVRKACDRMSEQEVLSLSQLRPIAEARPVPEGCVRVYHKKYQSALYFNTIQDSQDTHFADIRLPESAEKPKPETFEAHGKTWTKPSVQKPKDDTLIEWLLDSELEGRREYKADFVSTAERLGHWGGIAGWRYADEPTPEPLEPEPWTPKVGDVVTLKSGGPNMTVNYQESASVWDVVWISTDGILQCASLATACLQPA